MKFTLVKADDEHAEDGGKTSIPTTKQGLLDSMDHRIASRVKKIAKLLVLPLDNSHKL